MDDVAQKTIGVAGFDPLYRLRTTRINNSEFTNSGILLVTLPAFSFDFQNASKCHFEMRFPAKSGSIGVNNWSFTRYKTELY